MLAISADDSIQQHRRMATACLEALGRLMQYALEYGFPDTATEITFFKRMRPELESDWLFHRDISTLIAAAPPGGSEQLHGYYQQALADIADFFDRHRFLRTYIQFGQVLLDDKLFVRCSAPGELVDWGGSLYGDWPTARCSTLLAALYAKEKMAAWIDAYLHRRQGQSVMAGRQAPSLQWTGSKAALVELLYALQQAGALNGGRATIKELADFFGDAFAVDLGNYYRSFQELRIRKKNRTSFLDDLKTGLIRYMDETDLNYNG